MDKLAPSPLLEHFYNQAPKRKALDIGFGIGRDAIFLANNGFRVTAIDFNKNNADGLKNLASERRLSINVLHQDIKKFELIPNSYGLIIAMNSLFLLSDNEFKMIMALPPYIRHKGRN